MLLQKKIKQVSRWDHHKSMAASPKCVLRRAQQATYFSVQSSHCPLSSCSYYPISLVPFTAAFLKDFSQFFLTSTITELTANMPLKMLQ